MNFLRFSIIGVVGFVVDGVVLYLAVACGIGYYVGRLLSFLVASLCTWVLNRQFNFREQEKSALRVKEGGRYLAAVAVGGVLNYTAYACWIAYLGTAPGMPIIGVALGALTGLTANFLLVSRFVFGHTR